MENECKSVWKLVEVSGSRRKSMKVNESTYTEACGSQWSRCKSVEVDMEVDRSR